MEANVKLVENLKQLLSDQFVIYTKLRNYHWNVKGTNFFRLHSYFEQLYNELADDIDEIAERIKILGYQTPGSMAEFLELSTVKESENSLTSDLDMLKNIINNYEYLNNKLNNIIESKIDVVTEGMLINLLEKYEKHLWMMKSIFE
ncbi:MAG TPA: DNA starvation/stationary phase protection protein [Melioribacteraceae bacterium]|nr:DNA starvation/stationary phase protection protein [Melioribacteraceae bacterium]